MNRIFTLLTVLLTSLSAFSAPLVVEDFENVPVGTKFSMWGMYGYGSSTATVVVDPQNSSNHVLHVKVNAWGAFVQFTLPSEYVGKKMRERFSTVRFRFFRPSSDSADAYKQMHVLYGSDELYADQSYPYQGDQNTWQQRSYALADKVSEQSKALELRLGIHHDNSEYYIDDVVLAGQFDDFVTYPSGELNICEKNSSSSYKVYTTPTMVPEGTSLNVYTSRYTDFNAPFAGNGTLNLYAGGERTYMGEHSGRTYPSWLAFTGDVHIYPYKKVEGSAGFYGLVMGHNGKTFTPSSVEDALSNNKVCNMMSDNRVFLHTGAALATESGVRAAQFGELNTEAGSRIYGCFKATAGAGGYFLVGSSNTDATLAGRIAPMESNGKPLVTSLLGIIKEGKGTYTITANDNVISGGVRILEGRVNVCNDADAAETSKLSGGTGTPGSGTNAVYVMGKGVLGGTGNIAGMVDVYGTVEPGTAETGTLLIKDFVANAKAGLTLHPASRLRFKIKDGDNFDRLVVNNDITLDTRKEDFTTSDESPVIRVSLDANSNLSVGDEFTVLVADHRLKSDEWSWKYVFPEHLTWTAEERTLASGKYALVVKVTSLADDPANEGNDKTDEEEGGNDDSFDRTFSNTGDATPLRQYAEAAGGRIGVAIPSSRVNLFDANDTFTKTAKREFNMVVPENELKFENCEPGRNYFAYGDADNLLSFAEANNMYMRGHTLAWHNQLAQWVSTDGKKNDKGWTKKELLDILKNHIMNVVGHYKGRIGEWDVVNECLDDDQSVVYTNASGYKLRQQSIFTTVIGEEFIDSAFVWAHRADPDAKLYLNDYDNESRGSAKSEAFYNLVKRLLKDKRPIHGVGFQCHLDAGKVKHDAIKGTLARFKALGLETAITELDLGIDNNTDQEQLQQQARDYYRIVNTAMSDDNCKSVMIWGLSDNLSWRASTPLIYDASTSPKPAYYAVKASLAELQTTGIDTTEAVTDSPVLSREYYTVGGMKVSAPVEGAITIVRERHSNGTVKSYKIMK